MSDTGDRFIWIDIETTGLNPEEELLLEVGFRITDIELNLLGERDWQIWDTPSYDERELDSFILNMHTKSGLLDDCQDHGSTLDEVCGDMQDWLSGWGVNKSDPMCGSSVQFDRSWMGIHLPLVHDMFSYRNVDISTVKELCRRLNPVLYGKIDSDVKTSKREIHRALPDLQDTCSEAGFYFENFLWLGDGA